MYLKELRLENYRSFQRVELEFSKITLLLGANSSGKTALLNGLLSIIQSDKFPLYLNPNGPLVETGDFLEIAHRHQRTQEVRVAVKYAAKKEGAEFCASGNFGFDPKTKMPALRAAEFKGGAVDATVRRTKAGKYRLTWTYLKSRDEKLALGKDMPEFVNFIERMHTARESTNKAVEKERDGAKSSTQGLSGRVESALDNIEFKAKYSSPWVMLAVKDAFSTSTDFRPNFRYLGSYRSPPRRTYFNTVGGELAVGVSGQNAVEQVIDWSMRNAKQLSGLIKVMKKVGLVTKLNAAKLSGGRVELRVRAKSRGTAASITDVGFGVNQFLPIAVAEMQMSNGSTIAISQPETHLHPSAQAAMGEHFANQAKERGFRYIIETHSEYMINRLRRLISRGDLKTDDVAAYYVVQKADGSSDLIRMHFCEDGSIENAPTEFFETYQTDVLGIAMRD